MVSHPNSFDQFCINVWKRVNNKRYANSSPPGPFRPTTSHICRTTISKEPAHFAVIFVYDTLVSIISNHLSVQAFALDSLIPSPRQTTGTHYFRPQVRSKGPSAGASQHIPSCHGEGNLP